MGDHIKTMMKKKEQPKLELVPLDGNLNDIVDKTNEKKERIVPRDSVQGSIKSLKKDSPNIKIVLDPAPPSEGLKSEQQIEPQDMLSELETNDQIK